MEDTKIIELFWNRDEAAIEAASEKYTPLCYKIAWNILSNREDSEECVNDTWFSAWRYIPPKHPTVLSAFLGRITRGFAIDMLRRKYAQKSMDMHTVHIIEEAEWMDRKMEDTIGDHMKEQEIIQTINRFLRSLKPEDRDIFVRRFWYMDSIQQIAKRHGSSESKIKSNLFRNKKRLMKQFAKLD